MTINAPSLATSASIPTVFVPIHNVDNLGFALGRILRQVFLHFGIVESEQTQQMNAYETQLNSHQNALKHAITEGNYSLIKSLLKKNYLNKDQEGQAIKLSPAQIEELRSNFRHAIHAEQTRVVKWLLNMGYTPNNDDLASALAVPNLDILLLLQKQPNVNKCFFINRRVVNELGVHDFMKLVKNTDEANLWNNHDVAACIFRNLMITERTDDYNLEKTLREMNTEDIKIAKAALHFYENQILTNRNPYIEYFIKTIQFFLANAKQLELKGLDCNVLTQPGRLNDNDLADIVQKWHPSCFSMRKGRCNAFTTKMGVVSDVQGQGLPRSWLLTINNKNMSDIVAEESVQLKNDDLTDKTLTSRRQIKPN